MFCSECGQQSADDAKFCMKCGKKLIAVETVLPSSLETEKPSDQAIRDSVQTSSSSSGDSAKYVSTELKESGAVTAMSVIGFVFGMIGMGGSFIPCIGSLAFYIGIPAAIISAIALGIAYSQNAKRTFAIVAVTISLIGVVISGWQYFSIISAGKNAERETKKMFGQEQPKVENRSNAPAAIQDQVPASSLANKHNLPRNTKIYSGLLLNRQLYSNIVIYGKKGLREFFLGDGTGGVSIPPASVTDGMYVKVYYNNSGPRANPDRFLAIEQIPEDKNVASKIQSYTGKVVKLDISNSVIKVDGHDGGKSYHMYGNYEPVNVGDNVTIYYNVNDRGGSFDFPKTQTIVKK